MYFSLHPIIRADCVDLLIKSFIVFVCIDLRRIVRGLLYADVTKKLFFFLLLLKR